MLLKLGAYSLPAPPETFFGRVAPLVLEVGFGDGGFLAHLARTHPAWNLLGAEVSVGSVSRAFRRIRRAGHRNVRLYAGHARFLVRNVVPPHGLHRVYVNFPDPWPKQKHRGRRLLRAPFFRLLSTRLEDGGALLFTTDHAEYFGYALAEARRTGLFAVEQAPPPPATLETKYARKWRAQAIPIQHAVFTKTAEADAAFPPLVDPADAMHHALLAGTLPPLDRFEKIVHPFEGGHVIVLEAYGAVGGAGLVFVTRIEEQDLTQEVLVEARPDAKDRGRVLVRIKAFGQPLLTRGTREAIRAVVGFLEPRGLRLDQAFF
ncbi:MAG: tRNA (guanosine(46)-N7)-methyltransferase TrmB [Rhodothermales bacterium]|nr:tRNA (guanosine(46)-N7)-methyltransferase TrmB [Rhodothermales bacterium]